MGDRDDSGVREKVKGCSLLLKGRTVMYGPLKHHRPLKQFEFPGRPPLTSNFFVLEYMIVYINLTVI